MKAVLHNPNPVPVSEWVYCGLPPNASLPKGGVAVVTDAAGTLTKSLWHAWGRGLVFQVANLAPGSGTVELRDDVIVGGPGWQQHPHLNLLDLLPTWSVERAGDIVESLPIDRWLGTGAPSGTRFVRIAGECPAALLFHVRCSTVDSGDPDDNWTHDLYVTAWSGLPFVDFVTCSVRGNVADRYGQLLPIPDELRLQTHGPTVALQLRMPDRSGVGGVAVFRSSNPQLRHNRALRFVARGRMMNQWRQAADKDGGNVAMPELQRLLPVRCVLASADWNGRWLAGESLPAVPQNANEDHVGTLRLQEQIAFGATLPQPDAMPPYFAPRPFVQPIESWTTGEQPGFGASSCGRIVSMQAPELLPLLEYSAEAYCYRPNSNREQDGSPVLAENHRGARTQSHRPDNSWTEADRNDRIGWPFPPVWPVGPTTSDDQHRDASTLHAAVVLLNCPVLESVVFDHVEMTKLDAQLHLGWCPAARACGRLFLDYAGQVWLGHDVSWAATRLLKLVQQTLTMVDDPAEGDAWPIVFAGPLEPAKYGWIAGRTGRQPWQQVIVAIGARALALACDAAPRSSPLRDLAAPLNDLAIDLARTVLRTAWFRPKPDAPFVHVYAFAEHDGKRWPPPASSLTGVTNDDVFIAGDCEPWDAAACVLLQNDRRTFRSVPDGNDIAYSVRASFVLSQLGQQPKDWAASHWRAVRPFTSQELGQ